jgi:hypothetical protein
MTRSRDVADTQDNLGGAVAPFVAGKNIVINGAMEIAQRTNTYTYGTGGGTNYYPVDRFRSSDYTWSAGSNITVSQSTTAPSGFNYSYKVATGATGLTFAAGGSLGINHLIEGSNIALLANSSAVTLSFWVNSSVTGTYSIWLGNADWGTASPTSALTKEYTITTANTWQKISIAIPLSSGTAIGSWNYTTGQGLEIYWNLGANANRVGNAYLNTWASFSSYNIQTSSSVQWATNANATFYMTGVQLELGAVATPFARAGGSIGGELALCQRYFYRLANGTDTALGVANFVNASTAWGVIYFPVTMRVAPTLTAASGTNYYMSYFGSVVNFNTLTNGNGWVKTTTAQIGVSSLTGNTAGYATTLSTSNASATVDWNAEL